MYKSCVAVNELSQMTTDSYEMGGGGGNKEVDPLVVLDGVPSCS